MSDPTPTSVPGQGEGAATWVPQPDEVAAVIEYARTHWSERGLWALLDRAEPALRAELFLAWAARDAAITAARGFAPEEDFSYAYGDTSEPLPGNGPHPGLAVQATTGEERADMDRKLKRAIDERNGWEDQYEEVAARLALWEAARPAISALYGGAREALTWAARRKVCDAILGVAVEGDTYMPQEETDLRTRLIEAVSLHLHASNSVDCERDNNPTHCNLMCREAGRDATDALLAELPLTPTVGWRETLPTPEENP